MNTNPDLLTVADIIEKMRAEGSLLDYSKYSKLAVMLEAFADGLDREIDLQSRTDPREDAVWNVSEKHSEHRQFVGGCDRCEDQLGEAREMMQEMDRE